MTVNGVVENEDVDYFAIEAKKGERITAELEGLRTRLDMYARVQASMAMREKVFQGYMGKR